MSPHPACGQATAPEPCLHIPPGSSAPEPGNPWELQGPSPQPETQHPDHAQPPVRRHGDREEAPGGFGSPQLWVGAQPRAGSLSRAAGWARWAEIQRMGPQHPPWGRLWGCQLHHGAPARQPRASPSSGALCRAREPKASHRPPPPAQAPRARLPRPGGTPWLPPGQRHQQPSAAVSLGCRRSREVPVAAQPQLAPPGSQEPGTGLLGEVARGGDKGPAWLWVLQPSASPACPQGLVSVA